MKAIQFTKEQIEARENGATMFMVPIGVKANKIEEAIKSFGKDNLINSALREAPLREGDEFFIQEEFCELSEVLSSDFTELVCQNPSTDIGLYVYRNQYEEESLFTSLTFKWSDASQMQEHQSRYKDICLDVEIKRVGDIFMSEVECLKMIGNVIDNTFPYEKDDYVFLITCKGIQK